MDYGSVEGFESFFSPEEMYQLELLDTPAGAEETLLNTNRIQKNLDSAAAVIDAIFPPAKQERTANLNVAVLEHIQYEFARYFLDKNLLRETVKERYQEAMKLLERIAEDSSDGVLGNIDSSGGDDAGGAFKRPSVGHRVSSYESILTEV